MTMQFYKECTKQHEWNGKQAGHKCTSPACTNKLLKRLRFPHCAGKLALPCQLQAPPCEVFAPHRESTSAAPRANEPHAAIINLRGITAALLKDVSTIYNSGRVQWHRTLRAQLISEPRPWAPSKRDGAPLRSARR